MRAMRREWLRSRVSAGQGLASPPASRWGERQMSWTCRWRFQKHILGRHWHMDNRYKQDPGCSDRALTGHAAKMHWSWKSRPPTGIVSLSHRPSLLVSPRVRNLAAVSHVTCEPLLRAGTGSWGVLTTVCPAHHLWTHRACESS